MREMRTRVSAIVCVITLGPVLLVAPQAAIIFGERALPTMIGEAVSIVVGTVVRVTTDPPTHRTVTVRVVDTWKGVPSAELNYLIPDHRIACDASDGVVGETVVLFLGKSYLEGRLEILKYGRGRMQIQGTDADPIVLLTLPTPERLVATPTRGGSGSKLSTLKAYVVSVVNNQGGR